ncbi:hypothetical protein, partial [Flavobacterium sp.]|uniref:hypothetical protein n=1 Tax=Flavobacterium sp. TaxID=239 RepID=UPI0025BCD502
QRGLLLPRRKSNKRARGTTDFGDLTALEIRELKELAETFLVREPFWVAQTAFNSANFQDVRCPPKRSNAGLIGKCLLTFSSASALEKCVSETPSFLNRKNRIHNVVTGNFWL